MTRHLASPFEIDRSGAPRTVAQDSEPEVRQCVLTLLQTRLGSRPESPEYGIDDPLFGSPDVEQITAAIAQWEPRTDATAVLSEITDAGEFTVSVSDD